LKKRKKRRKGFGIGFAALFLIRKQGGREGTSKRAEGEADFDCCAESGRERERASERSAEWLTGPLFLFLAPPPSLSLSNCLSVVDRRGSVWPVPWGKGGKERCDEEGRNGGGSKKRTRISHSFAPLIHSFIHLYLETTVADRESALGNASECRSSSTVQVSLSPSLSRLSPSLPQEDQYDCDPPPPPAERTQGWPYSRCG